MTQEFKGTRGEIEITLHNEVGTLLSSNGKGVLTLWGKNREANANLIVDAFKVRQQINCELSELLEQNNQNLILLKDCLTHFQALDNLGIENNVPTWIMNQLIKKVKDNE